LRSDGAEHRAEERAANGRAHCQPEHLAAALARSRRREPGERSVPAECGGEPLDEPRQAEQRVLVDKPERDAARRDEQQPGDGCPLDAEPGCAPATGDRTEDPPDRVHRHEDAGGELGEAERLLELREQRCERGEEDRLDENDRAPEYEKSTHTADERSLPKGERTCESCTWTGARQARRRGRTGFQEPFTSSE
jgi:hypothetical protein